MFYRDIEKFDETISDSLKQRLSKR